MSNAAERTAHLMYVNQKMASIILELHAMRKIVEDKLHCTSTETLAKIEYDLRLLRDVYLNKMPEDNVVCEGAYEAFTRLYGRK